MVHFNEFFQKLLSEFRAEKALHEIQSPAGRIKWPPSFGVYTLFDEEVNYEKLLYVGITGKYKRQTDGSIKINSATFKHRAYRWTPYRFCDSLKDDEDLRFSFRYGPKYSDVNQQAKIKYQRDAYEFTIPYENLTILTFDLLDNRKYSPAFLETLILNKYWTVNGQLPPANKQL